MGQKKRDEVLKIRLTASEVEALKQEKGTGGTLARFAREKLLNNTPTATKTKAVADYTSTVFQLKKIGTNINQIAHQLNIAEGSKTGTVVELKKALADLRTLADSQIDEVLK